MCQRIPEVRRSDSKQVKMFGFYRFAMWKDFGGAKAEDHEVGKVGMDERTGLNLTDSGEAKVQEKG